MKRNQESRVSTKSKNSVTNMSSVVKFADGLTMTWSEE